jgi:hypothetical protein
MRSVRFQLGATLLATLLTAAPTWAEPGDWEDWDLAGLVGVGIPVGHLGDVFDPGFSFTLSTTRWLSPRYGIRLGGAGNFFADAAYWHYNIGPEFAWLDKSQPWLLSAHAGVGVTTAQPNVGDSSTEFTVNLGATLEYKVNAAWSLIGGPSFCIIMSDETGYILPVSAGFRYQYGTH